MLLSTHRGAACELGCPSLIRAASQAGKEEAIFQRQAGGRDDKYSCCLGAAEAPPFTGAFSFFPLKRDGLSSVWCWWLVRGSAGLGLPPLPPFLPSLPPSPSSG